MSYQLFIFTDIHGHLGPLLKALKEKGFDDNNKNHILISLGDHFDRGTQNKEIFEYLLEKIDQKRFFGIFGNHDAMFLNFIKYPGNESHHLFNIKHNGMYSTVESFMTEEDNTKTLFEISQSIAKKNKRLFDFFEYLQDQIIIDNQYVLTHAGYKLIQNQWIADHWTNTPNEFIDLYPDEKKTYIFGHFHASRLNEIFNPHLNLKEYEERFDAEAHQKHKNIFFYKNYIGLDTNTVRTNLVNVFVLEIEDITKIHLSKNEDRKMNQ